MECVKGFRDIEDASKKTAIRNVIENVFQLYDFTPVETPIIEYEEFVKGDNEKDEAVSDIFKLKDRGKRNLALRYEFTFQLKRVAKNKKLPYKRYQIGPLFRDEPIGPNRWRQFFQCDADIIGADINSVAEILKIGSEILNKLKVNSTIYVNNRKLLNEVLDEFGISENNKEQVIKEIDKLDKLTEKEVAFNLEKYKIGGLISALKNPEKYFEKYEGYKDIKELKKLANILGFKIAFDPFLARGLSYYNWIVFEAKSRGFQGTLFGGGSYLVNGIQATGLSFGLDRLESLAEISLNTQKILVVSLGENEEAVRLAEVIRERGVICSVYSGKLGKALDYANSYKIPFVIFVGEEEIKKGKFKIKNMDNGKEKSFAGSEVEKILKGIK